MSNTGKNTEKRKTAAISIRGLLIDVVNSYNYLDSSLALSSALLPNAVITCRYKTEHFINIFTLVLFI